MDDEEVKKEKVNKYKERGKKGKLEKKRDIKKIMQTNRERALYLLFRIMNCLIIYE